MLKVIGNKIKKARKDCNLTLKDLEVKTSVNYVTLSRIERGKRDITVLELKKIYVALLVYLGFRSCRTSN